MVSSADYSHSAHEVARRAPGGWHESSLSGGNGACVEVETAELRGKKRLGDPAYDPRTELVPTEQGRRDVRARAALLVSLVLAAGLAVAMIAWAARRPSVTGACVLAGS